MKISTAVSRILTDKYVLYFVLFLAVTNLLGYLMIGNLTAVLFFIVVAYLMSNFSKNMIVVLGTSLLLTNVLMLGHKVKEGLENASDATATAKTADAPATTATATTAPAPAAPASVAPAPAADKKKVDATDAGDVKPAAKDEGMNVMSNKKRNRIDYASTIEDAYDDLNNILGGEGIKQLTDDTQRLMGQQLQLADAMKSMTPLLENAKSMLKGFDLKNLDGIADFAKNFSAN